MKLYPLKFVPILKERIWGGTRLSSLLHKNTGSMEHCGESWELSSVEEHVSVVTNGFLEGNNLQELIEIYMGDLVGEKVYERFGDEFPLLIKFIDAENDLSIQVHPDDKLSKERHNAYGKTEMWYVLDAEPGSQLNSGFNRTIDRHIYLEYLESGKLTEILNFEEVKKGDAFFIPAGRVHAIGKGIMIAEIQQTSDITYRIFDYNRTDKKGKHRKLHTELALDAIDFTSHPEYKTSYSVVRNESSRIISCNYFTTNLLEMDAPVSKEYSQLDSFKIYICVEGSCTLSWDEGSDSIFMGDTMLVPAGLEEYTLTPLTELCRLLEVYII
jgi:mannose-6-phosphate isomerase